MIAQATTHNAFGIEAKSARRANWLLDRSNYRGDWSFAVRRARQPRSKQHRSKGKSVSSSPGENRARGRLSPRTRLNFESEGLQREIENRVDTIRA